MREAGARDLTWCCSSEDNEGGSKRERRRQRQRFGSKRRTASLNVSKYAGSTYDASGVAMGEPAA